MTDQVAPVKRGRGRPEYQPTQQDRGYVKAMAGMGFAAWEIAKVLGISEPTVRKHYPDELLTGGIEANSKVASSLFKMATDAAKPNVVAAIFWLKSRAGWRDSEPKEDALGKKEAAERLSQTAHRGTAWEDVLTPPEAAGRHLQ